MPWMIFRVWLQDNCHQQCRRFRSAVPSHLAYLFISGMAIPRVLSLILRWLVEVPSCRHMAELIESTVDSTEGHRICGAQNCYRWNYAKTRTSMPFEHLPPKVKGSEIEANWARLLSFFNLKSTSKSKQFQHVAANINRCIFPGVAWIGMSVRRHGESFSISELTFLRPKEINESRWEIWNSQRETPKQWHNTWVGRCWKMDVLLDIVLGCHVWWLSQVDFEWSILCFKTRKATSEKWSGKELYPGKRWICSKTSLWNPWFSLIEHGVLDGEGPRIANFKTYNITVLKQ